MNACGQNENVTCWVSRPWEKGIFVMYMAFFACLSIVLPHFGVGKIALLHLL